MSSNSVIRKTVTEETLMMVKDRAERYKRHQHELISSVLPDDKLMAIMITALDPFQNA